MNRVVIIFFFFQSPSCCKILRPPTELQVFANFFTPPKCYNTLSPLVLSRSISARLFSVPQVENEVKKGTHFAGVAEIQKVVTDELTFRHRASCILGQAFRYFPENAFYIFNQQIYFII